MENERNFESDWAGWTVVEKPMAALSLYLPEEMVEQLKQIAPRLGFEDYQDLIQYYVHNGMRRDLEAMQAFGSRYEIARKMAEDGASADEITAFLKREGNQGMDEAAGYEDQPPISQRDDSVIEAIKKQIPDADEHYERNLKLVAEHALEMRHRLLENAVKTDQAACWLRVSPQEVMRRISDGELLALQDGKDCFLPDWQFDSHTPDGLVAGLPEVLQALKTSDMSYGAIANWLSSPNNQLSGQAPITVLQNGDKDEVLWAVNTLLEH